MGNRKQFSAVCTCLSVCLLLLTTLGLAFAAGVTGERLSNSIEGTINPSLVVPSGNVLKKVLYGVGDQIYAFFDNNWNLVNVSASLYDGRGKKIGHHFFSAKDSNGGQATWETFDPPSRVTAKTLFDVPQENSIPWLLNVATSNSGNIKQFGRTTFVQRLYTIHGTAPDIPGNEGDIYKSSYSAIHFLFQELRLNFEVLADS